MKPMEMAEALFGSEDGMEDASGLEAASEVAAEVQVDGAAGAATTGSVDAAALKSVADFMEKQGKPAAKAKGAKAGKSTVSEKSPKVAAKAAKAPAKKDAKPSLGPPMDLAAAREAALKNGTAPAHFVEATERAKTGAPAKVAPALSAADKAAQAGVSASVLAAAQASVAARKGGAAKPAKGASAKSAKPAASAKKAAAKAAAPQAPTAVPAAGRTADETADLTLLGNQGTRYPQDYDPSVLETFDNKHPDNDYFVKFNCPEFTSLCPITGQPDFATIYISYVPGERMVESKSLKLYLFSFRNHGDFHEDCMNIIMKDLIALMDPKYIEVWGKFTPRGGISIDPYCNYGRPGTRWEEVAWDRLAHHDLYPEKVDNR